MKSYKPYFIRLLGHNLKWRSLERFSQIDDLHNSLSGTVIIEEYKKLYEFADFEHILDEYSEDAFRIYVTFKNEADQAEFLLREANENKVGR